MVSLARDERCSLFLRAYPFDELVDGAGVLHGVASEATCRIAVASPITGPGVRVWADDPRAGDLASRGSGLLPCSP